MQLEALQPFIQQFQQSLISGCRHVIALQTHPKRTFARWLAVTSSRGRARLPAMCGIAGIVGSRASVETARGMAQRPAPSRPGRGGGVGRAGRRAGPPPAGHTRLVRGGSSAHVPSARRCSPITARFITTGNCAAQLPARGIRAETRKFSCISWRRKGAACLDRLVGMFAFACWDTQRAAFIAGARPARDQAACTPAPPRRHRVRLGTQKALLVLGQPQIDPQARCGTDLFHGYIPAPKTIYGGIEKLPAGHTLTWTAGRVSIERYWHPPATVVRRSADDALQRSSMACLREVRAGAPPCRMCRSESS